MRICIRIRVMRLMSDSVYAYAYGRLYIYEIDQSINKVFLASKVTARTSFIWVIIYEVAQCTLLHQQMRMALLKTIGDVYESSEMMCRGMN